MIHPRSCSVKLNFYPRSPCGERRRSADCNYRSAHPISIHALLAESDNANLRRHRGNDDFYPRSPCGERHFSSDLKGNFITFLSTLSLRRATHAIIPTCTTALGFLSTLSLRRATTTPCPSPGQNRNFYPRSPCGERRLPRCRPGSECQISIHALLAESDVAQAQNCEHKARFLSTLSLRRATSIDEHLVL